MKLFVRTDNNTSKKTLKIFFDEMSKDKKSMITYFSVVPINRAIYIVALPLIFSFLLQSLIQNPHDWQHPVMLLILAAVLAVISLIAAYVGFHTLFNHEEHIRTVLTERAMKNLMSHSDQFYANKKIGSLAGDMSTFTGAIIVLLDSLFLNASSIIINFLASLIIIAILSPILLIPLAIITVFIVFHSIYALSRRAPLRHERKTRTSQLSGTVADILGNQQIVRFFAMGQREVNRVVSERLKIEKVANREIDIIRSESVIRQAVLFGFQIATMAVCVALFTTGNVTIAALVFTVTYLGRLTSSMFEITPIIRTVEQAFLDSATMTEILQEKVDVTDSPQAEKLKVSKAAIDFNDVHFAYQDQQNESVIDELSLHITPGQRVGLAGHSGGGKTTLTKLLLRFADIESGSITIDGQDISKVTQKSLRESIAYVPQEAYLFHRSLRENIAYGRPGATDQEIMDAVYRANAQDFIEALPNGLDTVVGERGVKLSGGQRQRVALARAILKDAPILVLDEATSALDSESERLIQDALSKLMKGRTSIVVAHRLSTIAKLDRIIVMSHGKIIEDGTHSELLAVGGTYAKLWAHQSGGFIEE